MNKTLWLGHSILCDASASPSTLCHFLAPLRDMAVLYVDSVIVQFTLSHNLSTENAEYDLLSDGSASYQEAKFGGVDYNDVQLVFNVLFSALFDASIQTRTVRLTKWVTRQYKSSIWQPCRQPAAIKATLTRHHLDEGASDFICACCYEFWLRLTFFSLPTPALDRENKKMSSLLGGFL